MINEYKFYGVYGLYVEDVHPADKQHFSQMLQPKNKKLPNQVRCNKPRLVRKVGMRR